ncbi:hypothetical protein INP77_06610 [Methylophilus sp. 13]|uniref:hypothetical protein n=1 Tax=Methylophilus sp. 13 TaxID=2781018 RepID=UPI0018901128|nr:hypothetical protein [Methylophilus sp. 13]MBF5039160.1 hypothetical protein [Methylophilus sp. 13]
MNKTELEISKLIKPTLEAEGFALKKDWNSFVRYTDYGFDDFMIVDQGHLGSGYKTIGCAFGVRHDVIQNLFNSMGLIYGEEAQKQNVTLALSFPFIPWQSRESELKIYPETRAEDIQKVAQIITNAFKQHALPFYAKYADLRAVEAKINDSPMANLWPYTAGGVDPTIQVIISLLCAKAVNPNRYDLIKEVFTDKYIENDTVPDAYSERWIAMLYKIDAINLSFGEKV